MKPDISTLVQACAACGVLHASGYRCATARKLHRAMLRDGLDGNQTMPIRALAKGTK